MNYEKIIIELLSRIQILEEQMAEILSERENYIRKEEKKMTMNEIREYIETLKSEAKNAGNKSIVLRSGDIHKDLNLKKRLPMVCKAMWQCKAEKDIVLHTTPSGQSSTIEIEYIL